MHIASVCSTAAIATIVLVVAACAVGVTDPPADGVAEVNDSEAVGSPSAEAGPNVIAEAGGGGADSATDGSLGARDSGSFASDASIIDSSAPVDATVAFDSGGSADAGLRDSGGFPGTDSGPLKCTSSALCTSAPLSGTLSGDTVTPTVSVTGTTSRWVRVRVTENDNGAFAIPMTLGMKLVSPPGSNFDLFLYDGTPVDCVTPAFSSVTNTIDTLDVQWGETSTLSNGVDDSRDILVEVRYVGGTCPPSGNWKLSFDGNI
jgi:hypothetical protein